MTSRTRGALVAILFTAVVAASLSVGAQPASAADPGPGYDYQGDPHSHLGGYRTPDGAVGYCIEAGKSSPLGGVTTDKGVVDHVNGRSDSVMLQLSWVLRRYGNTNDDDTAAAVALVVWGLADPVDHASRGGDGFVITRAPEGHRAHILALADHIREAARTYRTPGDPDAELELSLVDGEPTLGTLEVTLDPDDATGTVELGNAVFSDTGLSSREGVGSGDRLDIVALTPADSTEYTVSALGTFEGSSYADGSVHTWSTPGAQTIASLSRRLPMGFAASATVRVVLPPATPPSPPVPPSPPTPAPPLPRVAG